MLLNLMVICFVWVVTTLYGRFKSVFGLCFMLAGLTFDFSWEASLLSYILLRLLLDA